MRNKKRWLESEFLDHVIMTNEEQCWEWTGAFTSGSFPIMTPGNFSARRYAYERVHGALNDDQRAFNICGNRRCVNPSHTAVGSIYADSRQKMVDDFWEHVRLEQGCWRWLGFIDETRPKIADPRTHRMMSARQFAWEIVKGEPLARSQQLRAKCGNTWCVNPDHAIPTLTPYDAHRCKNEGMSIGEIAARFAVTESAVYAALKRQNFTFEPAPIPVGAKEWWSVSEIAQRLKMSQNGILSWIHGRVDDDPLPAEKDEKGHWYIHIHILAKWLRERGKAGLINKFKD